jgi:hypothetical protein
MPDIKIPNVDFEKAAADFNNAVKEAAYVAVGLGVLGFQRAQVQRVELTKQVESQLANLSQLSATLTSQAEAYLAAVRGQVAQAREQLEKLSSDVVPSELPDPSAVRAQLVELAKRVDEAVAPVREQWDGQLDRLEEVLPTGARDVVQTVRAAASSQQQAVRNAIGLD